MIGLQNAPFKVEPKLENKALVLYVKVQLNFNTVYRSTAW